MATLLDRRSALLGLLGTFAATAVRAEVQPPRRSYAFDRNAISTGWRPFEFWQEERVFVPAKANGVETEVMLDSGVTGLVIDEALAARLGLGRDARFLAHGLSGQTQGDFSNSPVAIDLGGLVVRTNYIAILDLTPFADLLERPLQVVIGRDLFDQVMVDLDFEGRQVAFHDPRRAPAPSGLRAVPVREVLNIRTIPLQIEGAPPLTAAFDLGAGNALSLSPRYVADHPSLSRRATAATLSYGVEGWRDARLTTIRDLEIGGFPMTDVPASIASEWSYDARGGPPANLGIDAIQRFRVTTDFARGRIWLGAREGLPPFYKDRAGFSAAPREGGLEILLVAPEGPAAALGLTKGDRIMLIDGRAVADFPKGRPSRWNSAPAGTTVRITLAGGAEHSLVLADYF